MLGSPENSTQKLLIVGLLLILFAIPLGCIYAQDTTSEEKKPSVSPEFIEWLQSKFSGESKPKYKIVVDTNSKLLRVFGEFRYGLASTVTRALENNGQIQSIVLDSPGGRLQVGRQLAFVIQKFKLDTYSVKGCYSACTLAFIAGKKRFLVSDANLGFHQYSTRSQVLDLVGGKIYHQAVDRRFFRKQGVKESFLQQMFVAKHHEIWFPTIDELKSAGVIHGLISSLEELSNVDR